MAIQFLLLVHTTASFQSPHTQAQSSILVQAKGFSTPGTPPNSTPVPSARVSRGEWEVEYKDYIKRNGMQLCAMAWEGYEKMGPGAVFCNYSVQGADDEQRSATLLTQQGDAAEALISMYVPEGKLTEGGVQDDEAGDIDQVLSRIREYSPEREFVVCFETGGIMGADVVRPSVPPPEVARAKRG